MPLARAAAVLSNGLSPISSSTTSLPDAFSERAIARTVKAVSTDSERAKLLRRADTGAPIRPRGRLIELGRARYVSRERDLRAGARGSQIAPCICDTSAIPGGRRAA